MPRPLPSHRHNQTTRFACEGAEEASSPAGPTLDLAPQDEAELAFLADQPVTFGDFVEAVLRLCSTYTTVNGAGGVPLAERLRAMLGLPQQQQQEGGEASPGVGPTGAAGGRGRRGATPPPLP